ncbi:miniconductance mechanosensitive channel [Elusimicrobium posterum]|uniref:mechanosensitive ion channel family protein n=1 Tax=Elusimicrobium posterum TaxID=3116653 RepID=UPI003C7540E0
MRLALQILEFCGVSENYAGHIAGVVSLLAFLAFILIIGYIIRKLSEKYLIDKFFKGKTGLHYALSKNNFFAAIGYLAAGIIGNAVINWFFPAEHASVNAAAVRLIAVYFQICVLIIINKILSLVESFYGKNPNLPVKGIIQAVKLLINFFGGLIILAWFLGKEPLFFISALGLAASVLMLVFKDTILGLTASFQLSLNNMLKIGDWIEMPKHGADGDVVDISLTTVSVRNWDNTIVTIPSYDLISSSFKNWRGMSESGGRRIKRSIDIDVQSIKFLSPEKVEKLKKIELLQEYIARKEAELTEYNKTHKIQESVINGRYLTNIGTFRAYCDAYIKSRDYIHKGFTRMVRQLQPGPQGLPLEIYCFTNTVAWVAYEDFQSDLFDHLYAVMKEFDLRAFQNPGSSDIKDFAEKFKGGFKPE